MPDEAPLHAHEKLWLAVHTLVTGRGRVRDRLHIAVMADLIFAMPEEIQDAEVRQTLARLKDDLNCAEDTTGRGTLAATLKTYSEKEAAEVASRILDLYLDVRDLVRRSR